MISYGLRSFCEQKQTNTVKAVKLFTKETGLQADMNFTKFATWLDKKLKSKELHGNDKPLNKEMWDDHKREQQEWNAEMSGFSKEQKAFYKKFKEGHLDSFFGKKGINKPKQTEALTKLGKMIPIYDKFVELDLLEEFLNYKKETLC